MSPAGRHRRSAVKPLAFRSCASASSQLGVEVFRPGLERDTQLMPWLIADTVCGEVSRFLGVEIPARYSDWLDAKAERRYARKDHFRKLLRGRGNAPRDWLYSFMRHWLAALLDLERPDLYQCLPEDFNLGNRLPPGRHPLIRRKGCVPTLLPKPRPWDARRVLGHRRWSWLSGVKPADLAQLPLCQS